MNEDSGAIKIRAAKALDITDLPNKTSNDRTIVLIEDDVPTLDGFIITAGGQSIFVVKDVLQRNLKGPERRETARRYW